MRTYFYTAPKQKHEYNIRLLKTLCEINGVELTEDLRAADNVWVSCCDTMGLEILFKARKFGKPIIAGGSVSFMPVMRLWADYVCHGEAYNFIRLFSKVKHIEEVADFPMVGTATKGQGELDEFIDYRLNPLVQCNTTAYYYYCGKGCPQLCQYCALSWSRQWQKAPQILVERAIATMPKKGRLFPMVSFWDYVLPLPMVRRLGILDVKIKNYIRTGGFYSNKRIRTGIEFVREDVRKKLAKPLTQDEINAFVQVSKRNNHEAVLYFIGGLESTEEIIDHFCKYPPDMDLIPRMKIVFTYFEPQSITPMGDFNLAARLPIDRDAIFSMAGQVNRRFRFHPMGTLAHSTWRALMGRAETVEDADYYWGLRNETDNAKLLDVVAYRRPEHLGTLTLPELLARPRQVRKVKYDGGIPTIDESTG